MEKSCSKKSIMIALNIVCVIQIAVSLFWASKKNYLFFDEVFSYAAANNVESVGAEFGANIWMDESWFNNYTGVNSEHRFDYSIPYSNQISDVHPPLFYLFLHTACSLVPEQFSFMAGMSFNILFFVGCTIGLYFLGKELFGNKICGLLAGLLYAISFGGLNTMVFIRMYMLMALVAVLHLLMYLKYMERDVIPLKGYVFLGVTLIAGVLSQYYFLFLAFFLGVWYTLKFFLQRRYEDLVKYLTSIVISATVSLMIWPTMLHHLFGGVRGKEAQSNLLVLDGYLSALKVMFSVLNSDMFTKMLPIIILGMIGLAVICWKKRCLSFNEKKCIKLLMVLTVSMGYFFLVTKVAPYQMDRYLMPIYPAFYLLIVGSAYELLSSLIKPQFAIALCTLGFGGLSVIHMLHSGIPYTYVKNPNNIERHAIVEEYRDNYAIYISDNGECHHFTIAQILKEYLSFYHVYNLDTIEQTKEDMEFVKNEKQIVVYVTSTLKMERVNEFIGNIFQNKILDDDNLIDEDEEWNVYLLKIEKE